MTATPGWKGKVEYSDDDGSTWTELVDAVSQSPQVSVEDLDSATFGDQGTKRNYGRQDLTVDVELLFDMQETTHAALLTAVRAESEWDWRYYPNRDNASYFENVAKIFDPSLDVAGGSNNTSSFQLRNSNGALWDFTVA